MVDEALCRVVVPKTVSEPVAVRLPWMKVLPDTESLASGDVVPMPRLPVTRRFALLVDVRLYEIIKVLVA